MAEKTETQEKPEVPETPLELTRRIRIDGRVAEVTASPDYTVRLAIDGVKSGEIPHKARKTAERAFESLANAVAIVANGLEGAAERPKALPTESVQRSVAMLINNTSEGFGISRFEAISLISQACVAFAHFDGSAEALTADEVGLAIESLRMDVPETDVPEGATDDRAAELATGITRSGMSGEPITVQKRPTKRAAKKGRRK